MTPNAAASSPPIATPSPVAPAARPALSSRQIIASLTSTAAIKLPAPAPAAPPAVSSAPSFEITGLVVSEARKIDPAQRKRRKRPDEVDDDELVPEEDPTIAIPAPEAPAVAPYPYTADGMPYPYATDGTPLPQAAFGSTLYPPQPLMNPPPPVIPLAGGRSAPPPSAPLPKTPHHLAPLEGELPDTDDIPKPRNRFAIGSLVLLLLANVVMFGIAAGNNGIFHFGDIGGTLSAALGDNAPMELRPPPLPAPPAVEGLIPLGDDQDQPDLRLMFSPPAIVTTLNGDKVLVVYGQATNRANEALDEVILEGTLHDALGSVIGKSLPCPLLPLYESDASSKGLAARNATRKVTSAMSRDSLQRTWGEITLADPEILRVDAGETAGFLLIFPATTEPLSDQTLVEVGVLHARRALSN
jgi:hypothetical protein